MIARRANALNSRIVLARSESNVREEGVEKRSGRERSLLDAAISRERDAEDASVQQPHDKFVAVQPRRRADDLFGGEI